ncbi:hypothetical protein GCM10010279_33050 [Streptomyces mutabilis]|nr:hypothetical protein GCM10010279_33050 [Streptomyces mutabilis]
MHTYAVSKPLPRATGLNRSSIYSSRGDKDTLLPLAAWTATPRATAARTAAASCIADPGLPDGCLIAQSAMAIPALSPAVAEHARQALGLQRMRLRERPLVSAATFGTSARQPPAPPQHRNPPAPGPDVLPDERTPGPPAP